MKFVPVDNIEQNEEKQDSLSFLDRLTGFFKQNIESSRQRKVEIKERQRQQLKKTAPNYYFSQVQEKPKVDATVKFVTKAVREDAKKAFDVVFSDNPEITQTFYNAQYNMPYSTEDPRKRNPKVVDEYFQGFGSAYFIEPDVPIVELGMGDRAARGAGYFTGMATMAMSISAATVRGLVTGPMYALNGKKLSDAANLWNTGQRAEAIAKTGIGIKGGGLGSKLRPGGPLEGNLNRFFENVAKYGPDRARTLEFLRGANREGLIWTSLGQLSADDQVSMQQRIMRLPVDYLAGGLFARSQYKYAQILSPGHTFVNKAGKEVIGYKPSQLFEPVATSAIAGGIAPMMTSEGSTFTDRLIAAGVTTGISRLAGGFQFQTTRADVSRSLQIAGMEDATARSLIADNILVKVHNEMPKLLDYYSGLEFKNEKGFRAKLKKINTDKDDPAGQYSVVYDVYFPNGNIKQKNVVSRSFEEFFGLYRTSDYLDNIEPLKRGVERRVIVKDGEEIVEEAPIPTFQSEKDITKLIENGKFGILGAQNGPNRILVDAKPGYDYTDLLLEEILALGYNKKDIFVINSMVNGSYQPRVLVKGLKQNDAFELSRKFGQEGFENQSGFVQIKYNKGDNTKASNVEDVKLFKREPGMSMTTPTVTVKTKKGGGVRIVDDGEGGKKAKIMTEIITDDSQPVPKIAEFYTTRGGGRVRDHNLIKLNNGNTVAFKMSYDMGVANKTNIPKNLINAYGDDLRSAAFGRPAITGKDVDGLFLATRRADEDFGIQGAQARALRRSLFGKEKSNQLTGDEHITYQNLLYGLESYGSDNSKYFNRAYQLRVNTAEDNTWGTLGNIINSVGKVKDGIGNQILPMYRFWDYSSRKYNSPTMRKISYILTDKVNETLRLKEDGRIHMEQNFFKLAEDLGFSRTKLNETNMMALIMPEVFGPLSTLTKAERRKLKPLVDKHFEFTDNAFKILKDYNVKEKYINPKTKKPAWRDITKVDNFMPLTVTDDLVSLLHNNQSLKQQVLRDIQSDAARRGKKLTLQEALERFEQTTARSEKHGIYGTQFSRVFQLQPVYFLDDAGRVIAATAKDYKKQVGDTIGRSRIKIARRIESYDMNYQNSMDRYISRYANIAPNTKYFGYEGLWKAGDKPGSPYGSVVAGFMNRMKFELSAQDYKYYQSYLEDDLKELMGLKSSGPVKQFFAQAANNITGFTATALLSGTISPIKNFGLGSAQSYSTFAEEALARGGANYIYDQAMYLGKGITTKDFEQLQRSGAKLSGQKLIDTATNNFLFEQGDLGKLAQRTATIGMQVTEIGNRNVAAYTAAHAADMALEVLKGNRKGLITSNEQAVVNAERMLRETLRMNDESYYQLMSKKRYFDKTGKEIYLTADDVDLGAGVMKEYKVGDKIGSKVVAEAIDDPQEFTEVQRIMIMSRGHSMTQGLTEAEYLPKIFNNEFLKPLTLFTRIATSVTDNVYNNVFRPAVEDGNVSGMLRYLASSYTNGAGIEYMYHEGLGTPVEQFRTPMQVHMDRLLTGEIGGIYQIIAETAGRGGVTSLANFTQAENIAGFLGDSLRLPGAFITQRLYSDPENNPVQASYYDLNANQRLKLWGESLAKLTALSAQAMKKAQQSARPEYQLYQKFQKYQNDYRRNILAEPQRKRSDRAESYFFEDKGRYIYDIMEKEFYSDIDINKVAVAVFAAVQYEADQALSKYQNDVDNPDRLWNDMFEKVMQYNVGGLDPVNLSTQEKPGVKGTNYKDFYTRLSSKDQQDLEKVKQFHQKRLSELNNQIQLKRAQYKNAWLSSLKDMEFNMGTIQIDL